MTEIQTPCQDHEAQIQENSRRIVGLETKAQYKEQSIIELKKDMKDLNDKMDKLSEDVNDFLLKSVNDDKDIDKRVTSLESTVSVLKWITTLLFGSGIIWVIINFANKLI